MGAAIQVQSLKPSSPTVLLGAAIAPKLPAIAGCSCKEQICLRPERDYVTPEKLSIPDGNKGRQKVGRKAGRKGGLVLVVGQES